MKHDCGHAIKLKNKTLARVFFCIQFPKKFTRSANIKERTFAMLDLFNKLPPRLRWIEKNMMRSDAFLMEFYRDIYPKNIPNIFTPFYLNRKKATSALSKIIKRCNQYNPNSLPRTIIILPTFLRQTPAFVFHGVIFQFINPTTNFGDKLTYDFAHEYFHVMQYYRGWEWKKENTGKPGRTLIDIIIEEAAADIFGKIVANKPLFAHKGVSYQEAKKALMRLKPVFKKNDHDTERNFYRNNKLYAHYGPYALGFYLVKAYKDANPLLTWEDVAAEKLSEIFFTGWAKVFGREF